MTEQLVTISAAATAQVIKCNKVKVLAKWQTLILHQFRFTLNSPEDTFLYIYLWSCFLLLQYN